MCAKFHCPSSTIILSSKGGLYPPPSHTESQRSTAEKGSACGRRTPVIKGIVWRVVHEKFVQGTGASGVVDGMGPKFMDFQLSQFESKSEYFCIGYN